MAVNIPPSAAVLLIARSPRLVAATPSPGTVGQGSARDPSSRDAVVDFVIAGLSLVGRERVFNAPL